MEKTAEGVFCLNSGFGNLEGTFTKQKENKARGRLEEIDSYIYLVSRLN